MELKCDEVNTYIQKNLYNYLPRRNYQYHAQAVLGKLGEVLLYFYDNKGYHLICLCNPYETDSQASLNYLAHFQSADGSSWRFNKIRAILPPTIKKVSATIKLENDQIILKFIYTEKEKISQYTLLFHSHKNWENIINDSKDLTTDNQAFQSLKWYKMNFQSEDWETLKLLHASDSANSPNILCHYSLESIGKNKQKEYPIEFSKLTDKELFENTEWKIDDVLTDKDYIYLLMTNQPLSLSNHYTALMIIKKSIDKDRMFVKHFQIIELGPDFTRPKFLSFLKEESTLQSFSYIGLMQSEEYVFSHDLAKHWTGVLTMPRLVKSNSFENTITFGVEQPLKDKALESLYIGYETVELDIKEAALKIEAESRIEWIQFLQANHYLHLLLSNASFQIFYAFDHNQRDSHAFTINYNPMKKELTVKRNLNAYHVITSKIKNFSEKIIKLSPDDEIDAIEIECLRDTNSLEVIFNQKYVVSFIFYEKYAGYDFKIQTQNQPLQILNLKAAKAKIKK